MPGTAAERGPFEPFNPVEALPKSGEFLAELRDEFGNLGLAAAAYNAGPQRLRDFLAGLRDLPLGDSPLCLGHHRALCRGMGHAQGGPRRGRGKKY